MKRYGAMTDKGHKTVWAPSRSDAKCKLIARGFKVISIRIESLEQTLQRYGL